MPFLLNYCFPESGGGCEKQQLASFTFLGHHRGGYHAWLSAPSSAAPSQVIAFFKQNNAPACSRLSVVFWHLGSHNIHEAPGTSRVLFCF